MRRVDVHAYPGTAEWIASQGPYVEPLGRYWKKQWTAKTEAEVVADFEAHGIEALVVAFDIESVTGAPPCTSSYVPACATAIRRRSSRRGERSTRSAASRPSAMRNAP